MYEVDSDDIEKKLDYMLEQKTAALEELAPGWATATTVASKGRVITRTLQNNTHYWHHDRSVKRGLRQAKDMAEHCLAVCFCQLTKVKIRLVA